MKKIDKLNAIVLCLSTLLGSMVFGSNALMNKENEVRVSDFGKEDIQVYKPDEEYPYERYEYPITPQKTPEIWKEFTDHQQMLDACEIPEEILKSMTTQQLLLTCLDYPLAGDAMFYDSEISGFNCVKLRHNGMTELFERPDFSTELAALYNDYSVKISEVDNRSYSLFSDYESNEDDVYCLTLMTRFAISESVLREDDVVSIYNYCSEISYCLDDTSIEHDDFLGVCQSVTASDSYDGYDTVKEKKHYYNYVTVKTPKGSSVQGKKYVSDLNAKALTDRMKYMNEHYPNATLVRLPTIYYNCHSYAWHMQTEDNHVWIDDPTKYMTDGSYKYVGSIAAVLPNPTGVVPGNKAFYKNPTFNGKGKGNHSAIVYSSSEYISKWGMGYLVRHVPVYCPYWDGDTEIRIYS